MLHKSKARAKQFIEIGEEGIEHPCGLSHFLCHFFPE